MEQKLGHIEASSEMDQHPTQLESAQQQQQRWEFQTLHLTRAWDVYHDLLLLPRKGIRWSPAATSFAHCGSACLENTHLLQVLRSFWLSQLIDGEGGVINYP